MIKKSFDLDTKTFINKHKVKDGVLQRNAKTDKDDLAAYLDIEEKKESYNTTKNADFNKAVATGNFDQVGYNAAYSLGINQAVAKKTKSIFSDITTDLFKSDSEIVNYYTNYDANQAKIEQEVEAGYGAANDRDIKLQQQKDAIESAYKTVAVKQKAKENQEKEEALNAITNVFSKFANLSDLDVGTTTTEADGFSIDGLY